MPGSEPATFGARLRGYRIAPALSQEELAERSGLSARGISDLERGARREPRLETVRMLGEALRLDPADLEHLLRAARPAAFGPTGPPSAAGTAPAPARPLGPARLPTPPTTLIGREEDLARAERLLAGGTRLLTLTGPGGVGKTRLALELGRRLEAAGELVALVELASVRDAESVPPVVLAAAGVAAGEGQPPIAALAAATTGRGLLLLLDNLEQVAGVAPWIATLLAGCPGVRAVATSRLPLRIGAERELSLPPLALPGPEAAEATVAHAPAVALFVERAAARAGYELTAADAPSVVAICRRLDGLPLAIELAAAWTRVLPPPALLARLESRPLDLVGGWADAPARHQSLRETIAWSHDLLRPGERALLRRLAVFAGGWDLEAAEAVAEHDPDALPTLLALVERSFVRRRNRPDGTARYALLETIRAFGLEQLEAHGDGEAARAAHAAWGMGVAREAVGHLQEADQAVWLARLRDERDNLQAALAWLLSRPDRGEQALELASTLWRFWHMQGSLGEGQRWLQRAIRDAPDAPLDLRADALLHLANVASARGNPEDARDLYERSLDAFVEAGNRVGEAHALIGLGLIATDLGNYPEAEDRFAAALGLRDAAGGDDWSRLASYGMGRLRRAQADYAVAEQAFLDCARMSVALEDEIGLAYIDYELAQLELFRGNVDRAIARAEAARAVFVRLGDRLNEGQALAELAEAARQNREVATAARRVSEALAVGIEIDDPVGVVVAVEVAARLAGDLKLDDVAARLLGYASRRRAESRLMSWPQDQTALEQLAHRVRNRLGAGSFLAAWQAGTVATLPEAAVLVRAVGQSAA